MGWRKTVPALCLALGAAGALPEPAAAQDWFTREACTTGEIRVWREVLSGADEARYSAIAGGVPNSLGRFWKITAPGGQTSWLWGTYHVSERRLLALPQELRQVLETADVVALEFNPQPDTRADIRRANDQAWMFISPGAPPDDRADFPPQILDHIALRLETYAWDPGYMSMMTDAGLFSLLLSDPCSDFTPFMPAQDYFIAQTGWLAGARITGLQEPWELGAELTAPERAAAARAALLLYGLYLGPDSARAGLRETGFALYLEGRIGLMDAWSDAWTGQVLGAARGREVVDLAESYLLVERNAIWMEKIRMLADQGNAVIAVGASHLPGDLGLVSMIRDAGYQVERVALPGEMP
ncbi:TraB/GumN family protein [Pseudomonas sp. GX19020]|uniref:TraB/GumN family protein n=1 Tax=Pseudomonas sp. GX19020 TaxID=2942277 RepID=UPI002019E145|nr:TraB/GumN family protein [Pseudomonas sp. GX19020]MCL4066796.1 TraB/GumN family protein [Pseudomonas sp. GX19020]